jgi:hypothetical protein
VTLRGTDTRLVAQRNDQVSRLTVQSNRLMATRRRDGATTQVEHPNRTDEEDPRAMEAFPGEGLDARLAASEAEVPAYLLRRAACIFLMGMAATFAILLL